MSPARVADLIGRRLRVDVRADQMLTREMLEDPQA
jgi:hypothetical protein